jgi:hypothetical protein
VDSAWLVVVVVAPAAAVVVVEPEAELAQLAEVAALVVAELAAVAPEPVAERPETEVGEARVALAEVQPVEEVWLGREALRAEEEELVGLVHALSVVPVGQEQAVPVVKVGV